MQLTSEQQAFKETYIRARGYWVDFNDGLLLHSPEWLEAYLKYAETPALEGPLEPRMREFIYIAVDTSTTHMFNQGLEIHINLALAAGCSAGELIEVMQIATMQGLDTVSAGMEILAEEAAAAGIKLADQSGSKPLLDRYESIFGTRPEWLASIACLAPRYAAVLIALLDTAEKNSVLSVKEKTLIRLALAASPTHLNKRAMRLETRQALSAGATPEEITEVFQLVSHLGIHACVDGVPLIMKATAK